MARKIRFPLKMKDGAAVRTLEELREHFDLESVLGYFADGKLETWFADRYYEEKAQKIAELSADMPDLNAKLCEIIGVEYSAEADETDLEYLQRRQEKLKALRMFTDDQTILDLVDTVAFDQDELYDILDEAPSKIYLYGEKFSIPYAKRGITYIGVNTPVASLEKSKYEYEDNGIDLINVKISDSTHNLPYVYVERLYINGDYEKALPLLRNEAENGNPRAMSLLAIMYFNSLGCEFSEEKGKELLHAAKDSDEPLSIIYYTYYCLSGFYSELNLDTLSTKQLWRYIDAIEKVRTLATSGDIIAQFEYIFFQKWVLLALPSDYKMPRQLLPLPLVMPTYKEEYMNDKLIRFLFESANKGFAPSIRLIIDPQNYSIVPYHSMFFSDDFIGSIGKEELEMFEIINRYYQDGKIKSLRDRFRSLV